MRNRPSSSPHIPFDASFISSHISAFPALKGGSPKVIAYLKEYYQAEKFKRLMILDALIRDERLKNQLTFQDIMDYLDFVFVQNALIFREFASLKADGYLKGDTDSQILVTAIFVNHVLDYLREFNRQTLIAIKTIPGAYLDKNSAGQVNKIYLVMDAAMSHLEAVLKKYDHPGEEALIKPVWRFSLYQNQLEGLVTHAQLWSKDLSGLNLKALGASSVVSKLEEMQRLVNNPQSHLLLQIMKAKVAYNINKQPSRGITLIEQAEKLRKQYADQGLLKPEEVIGLQFNILGIQLRYQVTRAKEANRNDVSALQAALAAAFELDDHFEVISPDDKMKESVQVSLFELFVCLQKSAQNKSNFAKLQNLDQLKTMVAQLERLMKLYEKTFTPNSPNGIGENLLIVKNCYEGFSAKVQSQEAMLVCKQKEREVESKQLASKKESYAEQFSSIIAEFPVSEPKPDPVKAAPVVVKSKDVNTSEESTESIDPDMPALISFEDAEIKLPFAEQCRRFFASHRLNQYYFILDEIDEKDHAEAMLYIGNHHNTKGFFNHALKWYESAIIKMEAFPDTNAELKEKIKEALATCEASIAEKLAKHEHDLKMGEQSKTMFIYRLGIEVCQKQGLHYQSLTEAEINALGEEKFIALGKRNREKGVQSLEEQHRNLLNENIANLKVSLSLTQSLNLRCNVWVGAVSGNPATLYYNEQVFPALTRQTTNTLKK